MNSSRLGLKVASVLFALVSFGHLLRTVGRVKITVADLTIPVSISIPAFVVCGAMALWLWRLSLAGTAPKPPSNSA